MISKYAVESAFAFFHQKQRIYHYSTIDRQKDDIEYAIQDYVSRMDPDSRFADDLIMAINKLEIRLDKEK